MDTRDSDNRLLSFLGRFERVIFTALICMMILVILLSTVELGWVILQDVFTYPLFLLEIDELLDIFGLFLLVLIGIELVYTLRAYLTDSEVHVEVVFAMALIAVARKVIILDVKNLDGLTLVGIAAVIVALSGGYYFVGRFIREVCADKKCRMGS
jgi:uncharacterized membrane protein (DUF373 family)